MVVSATDGLCEHAPHFRERHREEHDAITDFLLFWSFFEGNVLETHGSPKSITRTVRGWAQRGLLDDRPFQPQGQEVARAGPSPASAVATCAGAGVLTEIADACAQALRH